MVPTIIWYMKYWANWSSTFFALRIVLRSVAISSVTMYLELLVFSLQRERNVFVHVFRGRNEYIGEVDDLSVN
jgi:Ca2+/H+ antiporter